MKKSSIICITLLFLLNSMALKSAASLAQPLAIPAMPFIPEKPTTEEKSRIMQQLEKRAKAIQQSYSKSLSSAPRNRTFHCNAHGRIKPMPLGYLLATDGEERTSFVIDSIPGITNKHRDHCKSQMLKYITEDN